MRSLVVYESMYGNTHQIADRIGAALASAGQVDVVPVSGATPEIVAAADLLVVGGPTHVHTLSSRKSRDSARASAADYAAKHGTEPLTMDPHCDDPGLRDWFNDLPDGGDRLAAAFDTRLDARAVLTGRASKAIASRLKKHGYHLIAAPESFLVDKATRLPESELVRAQHWAAGLATAATADHHGDAANWS